LDADQVYEVVYDAVRQALADEQGGDRARLSRRLVDGKVVVYDAQERPVKELDVFSIFRKVTAVREKLRVMEQKINNHGGLSSADKAELQGYLTRCYGSLTTFNFLFRDDADRFVGTGGD
jgi:hypothetical protein